MTEQGPAQLKIGESDRGFPFALLPSIGYSHPDSGIEVRNRDAIDRSGFPLRCSREINSQREGKSLWKNGIVGGGVKTAIEKPGTGRAKEANG